MSGGGSSGDGQWDKQLRSKGLLPAIGVGAAVYFVTGLVSLGTLGLVGVGAGVGYGVGSWIADAYQKKQASPQQGGATTEQLPWALQVSLQQWQVFLGNCAAGGQLTPQQVEQAFQRFEQAEPGHAKNVRGFVMAGSSGPQAAAPAAQGSGPHIVPCAAEV
mmetsp:Transcript_120556/g.375359  ORF Transcript_120556/g.375359 Transcript_120556/m.375359 type:complete len:161 (-) Transcript_120556:61-543(-)